MEIRNGKLNTKNVKTLVPLLEEIMILCLNPLMPVGNKKVTQT